MDGFAKFAPTRAFDYSEFRLRLFEYVEKFRPVVWHADLVHQNTRDTVLGKFEAEVAPLPHSLYGDLPEHQILIGMKRKIEAEELIRRYNLALAQGLLYRCYRMVIRLEDSYKTVFHYLNLKLAQLIHKIQKEGEAYFIEVDGPFSLFRKTQKYGVNLARFLPGLLLADKWQMHAQINTEIGPRRFYLNQNCGLRSHYVKDEYFDSSVEEAFFKNFKKRKTDWEIEREDEILDLGDTVLIPDFKFTHPDGHGTLMEIVGFWTPEYLKKKLENYNE